MKKLLKFLGIFFLVIIVLIISIPVLFKGQLLEVVQKEINKNVNAKVSFADFNLSIFSSFPSLTVSLEGLEVVGKDKFENDTLAKIKQLFADVNLSSVISGDTYEITRILIDEPTINGIILQDSSANWDIAIASEEVSEEETDVADTASSPFAMQLELVEIKNATITYTDIPGNMYASIKNLNYTLSGNMVDDVTSLKMLLNIEAITTKMDGIAYLNETKVVFDAIIDADLANSKYAFSKNSLKLNELELNFDGMVAMPADDIQMNITFSAPQTEFKQILSLVPAVYTADFADVKTSGKFELSGMAKGVLSENPELYPMFDVNFKVTDAMFQYPDLPSSVENIGIEVHAYNKSSKLDDMVIDLKKFHIEMAQNPFDISMLLKTPMSDPFISAKFAGKIDLDKMKDIIPLEGTEMNGIITTDIAMEGYSSSIEKEQYEDFQALGSLIVTNFNYKSADVPTSVKIERTELVFSPQFVDLKSFDAFLGESDIHMNGKLENFIPYALSDGTLKGKLDFYSKYFNANDYIEEDTTTTEVETASIDSSEAIEPIPSNIDFTLVSKLDKVAYEDIFIENILGEIIIRNSRVDISNISMNMLGGTMTMKGYYSTQDITNPTLDLDLGIKEFDYAATYKFSGTVQKLAPIVEKCKGSYSTNLKINSTLLNDYSPELSSLNGFGLLESKEVKIEDSKTLNFIGEKVKALNMKETVLENLLMQFTIEDGGINIKPFETKANGLKAVISGITRLDQTIDFKVATQIPQKNLGSAGASLIQSLNSEASKKGLSTQIGENIDLDVLIGGMMNDPKIKLALGQSTGDTKNSLKADAEAELAKKKAELEEKARKEADAAKAKAKAEADKKKAEAEAKAKAEADKAKQKAEEEVNKKTEDVKNQAKDKLKKMW